MKKMWLVARREYLYNLKRRSFLFAVFGVPVFTFIVWGVVFLVMSNSENNVGAESKFGYVDLSGLLADPVTLPDKPKAFVAFSDEPSARAALDSKAVYAYFVLPKNYLNTGEVQSYSYDSISDTLKDELAAFLLANLSRGL